MSPEKRKALLQDGVRLRSESMHKARKDFPRLQENVLFLTTVSGIDSRGLAG